MICGACGESQTFDIKKMDTEDIIICGYCGYGYPTDRVPMVYTEDYERKYLSYPEEEINKIRLAPISDTFGSGLKVLDFGCGSGSFVRYARSKGFDAYGVDVNDFTKDLRPPAGFEPDIVTAWDSFEHLTEEQQDNFFKMAESAQAIIVSVPDFASADDIRTWRHYRPKEHLHYYTSNALAERFYREGFIAEFMNHYEDAIRKAPWKNNILTMGLSRS